MKKELRPVTYKAPPTYEEIQKLMKNEIVISLKKEGIYKDSGVINPEEKPLQNGRFHKWTYHKPEFFGGTRKTYALIETIEGNMIFVEPKDVTFTDNK